MPIGIIERLLKRMNIEEVFKDQIVFWRRLIAKVQRFGIAGQSSGSY